MSDIKILRNPTEILQHIDRKLVEDRFAHIQIKAFENRGVFHNWINRARLWYDPNVCSCKKKGLNEDVLVSEFKDFKNLNTEEKNKIYKIMGEQVEFRYGEEFIVSIP
jgi:uncharacterized protein YqkB